MNKLSLSLLLYHLILWLAIAGCYLLGITTQCETKENHLPRYGIVST